MRTHGRSRGASRILVWGQVERRRRTNWGAAGPEWGWGMGRGCPLPIGEGHWGLEMRILVHSVALLSADCIATFAL